MRRTACQGWAQALLGSVGAYCNKLPPGILPHSMPAFREIKPATTKEGETKRKEMKGKELNEEEKQVKMIGNNFQKFSDSAE